MKFKSLVVLSSIMSFANATEYFVKFSSAESLESASLTRSELVQGLRPVETKLGAMAVIESSVSLEELKAELNSRSLDVEYIEPNDIDYTFVDYEPSDEKYNAQWGLNDKAGANVEIAWQSQQGDKDLVIAVVDSGIDLKHPDLKRNLWVNKAEKNGKPGVDDDGNGFIDDIHGINAFANDGNPDDGNGHGTHCAGVIGAAHNNVGVAGVMADVQMMAVKIFTDAGRTSVEAIVRGIEYAIDNEAKIMSNSWGGATKSQGIQDAVEAAEKAGVLFVAAAGNGNIFGWGIDIDKKPMYPAAYQFDNIVSVGSIKENGRKSMFSNYGKRNVDLFAAGSDVMSTYKGQSYKSLSGTSMATPHVTGVAGLVASEYPEASFRELKSKLLNGVRKQSQFSNNSVSGGVLDAPGALGL